MPRLFPKLPSIKLLYIIELGILIVFGLYSTRYYADFNPEKVLNGGEMEWVTFSGQWAFQGLNEFGYLPQWQPYINRGQPAIEEAVGFILNPLSILPSVMFGVANGIKVSIIFHFLFAGVGGWFLGKTLGWSTIPRLTLGLLLIVKGNMQSVIGLGYFQLGTVQAYFPWVLAAAFAVVRFPSKRWPIIMLAVMLALVLFAGNLYYILPVVIIVGIAFLPYLVHIQRQPQQQLTIKLDRIVARRILQAGILTFGLSAVYFLPIFTNRESIGGHPNYVFQGASNPLDRLLQQYFVPTMLAPSNTWVENTYAYVSPLWFAGLLFILVPLTLITLHIKLRIRDKRVWLVGLVGFALFTFWAVEPNPVVMWLYDTFPVLGQWRVPTRMLAVSAFFLIFILALQLHNLWESAKASAENKRQQRATAAYVFVGMILTTASASAVTEVTVTRDTFPYLTPQIPAFDVCLEWLHSRYPEQPLAVWTNDNYIVWSFIRNHIRMAHVTGDYDQLGMPSQLYPYDLTNAPAEYVLPTTLEAAGYWKEEGYVTVVDSPLYYHGEPCLLRNPNALSYAFSVARDYLVAAPHPLPTRSTTPVQFLGRTPEHIWLQVNPSPDEELVVVAQDIAYPGWTVQVNGELAKLESVGQLLGVVIPPGDVPQRIEFIYTAPMLRLGGYITLISALFSIGYLLNLERFPLRFPKLRRRAVISGEKLPASVPALTASPLQQSAPSQLQAAPERSAMERAATPAHIQPSGVDVVRAEANADLVQIALPPSDKPYHLIVVYPARQTHTTNLLAFMTASLALLFLLALQRPRRK